jgi:FixJ family two-component response regulator
LFTRPRIEVVFMSQPEVATLPELRNVFIVDDDAGMRQSLEMVMKTAGLETFAFESAECFLADHDLCMRGVLILDIHLTGMDGVSLIQVMRERGWNVPVILLSGTATVPQAVQSMKLGVFDVLEKPVSHRVLLDRVQAAFRTDQDRRRKAAEFAAAKAKIATLTERERELLELIVSGHANKQVAAQLQISIKTVENHRANIMHKLGAGNAADLVRIRMLAA